MALNFKKIWNGLKLVKKVTSTSDSSGDLEVVTVSGKDKLHYYDGTSNSAIVTETHTAVLENKSFLNTTFDAEGTGNTLSNIKNSNIKAAAAIDASKIANGTVSNTSFQYVSGATSNIQSQLDSKATQTALDAKADQTSLDDHISDTLNPHSVTKAQVGLDNVDNTSDINKIVSTATQTALDLKADASDVYTKTESDNNFEPKNSNIQAHISDISNPHAVTKTQVGLSDVPNVDATLRANHTGTQLASTISDFSEAVDDRTSNLLVAGTNVTLAYDDLANTLTISSTGGGGGSVAVKEEGSTVIAAAASLNLIGASVTVTDAGSSQANITITSSGGSYADVSISALDIDWSAGTTFYKAVSASSIFTFSNIVAGKTITVAVTNATASAYNITFPTTKQEPGGLELSILANTSNIYTFSSINGIIYCSSFSGVV
jgi:hypothetical protein